MQCPQLSQEKNIKTLGFDDEAWSPPHPPPYKGGRKPVPVPGDLGAYGDLKKTKTGWASSVSSDGL